MPLPLMPKATAVWLVEHTALTFEQIGQFCGLHSLEIQAIADGDVANGMLGLDPVMNGQLSPEEIKRCEKDSRAHLKLLRSDLPQPVVRAKGPRYTPVSKRADKPDAISYLVKTYPELQDSQIAHLLGTTKDTIAKVRDRSHWNSPNIKPRDPILLGLCKRTDLEAALKKAQRRLARAKKAGEQVAEGSPFVGDDETVIEVPETEAPILSFGSDDQQPDIDPDDMTRSLG